jgi:hypothetical protein
MKENLEVLKRNLEELYDSNSTQTFPLLVDKSILDRNEVTVEEFIEYINPKCSVITSHIISEPGNPLFDLGIPEGTPARIIMIVGHREDSKQFLWGVYAQEDELYDDAYFMNQLLLYEGTRIVRNKLYFKTADGPIVEEREY